MRDIDAAISYLFELEVDDICPSRLSRIFAPLGPPITREDAHETVSRHAYEGPVIPFAPLLSELLPVCRLPPH